jgi:hypothetical protein
MIKAEKTTSMSNIISLNILSDELLFMGQL